MSTIRDAQFHLRQLREKLVLAGASKETQELATKIEQSLEKAYIEDASQKTKLDHLQQSYDFLKAMRDSRKAKPTRLDPTKFSTFS